MWDRDCGIFTSIYENDHLVRIGILAMTCDELIHDHTSESRSMSSVKRIGYFENDNNVQPLLDYRVVSAFYHPKPDQFAAEIRTPIGFICLVIRYRTNPISIIDKNQTILN